MQNYIIYSIPVKIQAGKWLCENCVTIFIELLYSLQSIHFIDVLIQVCYKIIQVPKNNISRYNNKYKLELKQPDLYKKNLKKYNKTVTFKQ